jgi:AcrR family transcriptional regulator
VPWIAAHADDERTLAAPAAAAPAVAAQKPVSQPSPRSAAENSVPVKSFTGKSDGREDPRGKQTRQLLLRAAERLFAGQGIARTSTRQITAAAGVSRDAIHYHFGSKAALVLAIVESRTAELRDDLDEAFARNIPAGEVTIRDIAQGLVGAAAAMASHETGRYCHPFLVALLNDPEFRHLMNSRPTPQSEALVDRLTPLTPGLDEPERIYRVASAMLLVLFGTGNGELIEFVDSQVHTTHHHLLTMLTDVVTNVLSGAAPAGENPTEKRV